MMCLIEIACLVFGIIILARGQVPLSSTKEVRGGPAYLIGLILIAIFPLALGIGFVVGFQRAQQGQPVNLQNMDMSLVLIDLGILGGCSLLALIIALATAQPRQRRKRRRSDEERDYDDYTDRRDADDFGRRSRSEFDDEDDERPRRRYEDDEDDDRPRRRDWDDRER
jgi:hypothetical protein